MKKVIAMLLALALVLALAACGSKAGSAGGDRVEGAVADLLTQVTDGATDSELSLVNPEVNNDNFTWYFFVDPIEGAEAAVSEPVIGSIAHFVGMLRVPEGTDPAAVKADIEAKLDPRKWVCTGAEKTAVVARGDLILVVMSTADVTDQIVKNFNQL